MNKIENLKIKGLRGINKEIQLSLNKKSILLYGDNGSGKSSITDALEWFFFDKIEHLSNEEIGRKGLEGLRNIHLEESEESSVILEFLDSDLNSAKIFNNERKENFTNTSPKFESFIKDSEKEQLLLRYRELANFILATKGEKLTALSEIIGFSEVIKTRDILRKSLNAIKKEITNSRFDSNISYQQQQLIEHLGQNVTTEKQYIELINNLIEEVLPNRKINSIKDLEVLLELLKEPDDTQTVACQLFLEKIKNLGNQGRVIAEDLDKQYQAYFELYQDIKTDLNKINNIKLESLLAEGLKVLKEDIIKDAKCPLCLQPKKKFDLLKELQDRLEDLQKYKDEKLNLEEAKTNLRTELIKLENQFSNILNDKNLDQYNEIKESLLKAKNTLQQYFSESEINVLTAASLKSPDQLSFDKTIFANFETLSISELKKIVKLKKDDKKFDVYSKISISKNAFLQINKLKGLKELLERQQFALDKINDIFIKKMEDGFKSFLSHLSKDINEFYVFMNPGEEIEDIKLIPIQKNEEFSGITIQFKFFDKNETPPNKYLSESHLNCLGIAFFLASVRAFNKHNKFFILDDVISSYDANHRIRFSHLLTEKFSDYQLIVLTHEKDWFDYFSKLVKNNWLINTFKQEGKVGPSIDIPLPSLKRQIEIQIENRNSQDLGNKIRKYLESLLKTAALKMGVFVRFQFNDKNEDRMPNEMLTALKSHLNKNPKLSLDYSIIDRLINSVNIGNKDSHDSSFIKSSGDCKALWADIIELEKLFEAIKEKK